MTRRTNKWGIPLKCPFCNSTGSMFSDYQLDPHSYFDTTNKGFITREERREIDNELRPAAHSLQLPPIASGSKQVLEEAASEP